jgi:hypothetical protein
LFVLFGKLCAAATDSAMRGCVLRAIERVRLNCVSVDGTPKIAGVEKSSGSLPHRGSPHAIAGQAIQSAFYLIAVHQSLAAHAYGMPKPRGIAATRCSPRRVTKK